MKENNIKLLNCSKFTFFFPQVITFGCNDEGALGREVEDGSEYIPRRVDIPERIVQISAGDSHTAALSESGQVYIWGNFRVKYFFFFFCICICSVISRF